MTAWSPSLLWKPEAAYERLRSGNVRALRELHDQIAADAGRAGLTGKRLATIPDDDEA